jgi:quinol monooxygenase YgiN
MVTLMTECRVADYDAWREQFDGVIERTADVLRAHQIWRDQDDPNVVVIFETFDSREIVEGLVNSTEVQEEMAAHGIDMGSVRIRYVDDVGSS